ncbi:hypothetical protein Tco_0037370 [Tanacetum coccineum]
MSQINPLKNSRVDDFVPNKHVKARVRTKSITVSQPHVIIKKDVNSNINGLSSTIVESTAKTSRLQTRRNLNNDRIPSASTSSCLSNNLETVEEHHRNLPSSKILNHRSSECNNIKLVTRNDKSEVYETLEAEYVSLHACHSLICLGMAFEQSCSKPGL